MMVQRSKVDSYTTVWVHMLPKWIVYDFASSSALFVYSRFKSVVAKLITLHTLHKLELFFMQFFKCMPFKPLLMCNHGKCWSFP